MLTESEQRTMGKVDKFLSTDKEFIAWEKDFDSRLNKVLRG